MPSEFFKILKMPINDTLYLLGMKMEKAKLTASLRNNQTGKKVTRL